MATRLHSIKWKHLKHLRLHRNIDDPISVFDCVKQWVSLAPQSHMWHSLTLSLPPKQTPWMELLSALSPEERGLLRAITDRGYPIHTAFIALQKTGQLTPDQVSTQDTGCPTACPVDLFCMSVWVSECVCVCVCVCVTKWVCQCWVCHHHLALVASYLQNNQTLLANHSKGFSHRLHRASCY